MAVAAGKDTDKTACEDPDLAQCSVEVVDEAAKQRSVRRKNRTRRTSRRSCHFENVAKQVHQARPWRHWAAGDWCWYWRSGKHKGSRMKGGVFLGSASVLLQERETTADGVRMNVVWITEGTSLVRCAVQHVRSLSESEKDCAASRTQNPSVSKTLSDICHTAHFLISRHRTGAPDEAWEEEEITGWDPRSTRDPSSGCSFWPQQPDATSRPGPDLVPPSRPVRADDEMSVQEPETTRVSAAHAFRE